MFEAAYLFLVFFSVLLSTYFLYFVYNKKAKCKNNFFYFTTTVQVLFLVIGSILFLKTSQSLFSMAVGSGIAVFGLCIKFSALNEWARRKTKIINSGIYSLIRHPMYTGNIITYLGLSFIISVYGFALFFMILPAFIVRGKMEERKMSCIYSNYKKRVSAFIPSI